MRQLAKRLGVAPSLVVALADQLQELGAVERVRDAEDRRRQVLRITSDGRRLLSRCVDAAHALDAELTVGLDEDRRHLPVVRAGAGAGRAAVDRRCSSRCQVPNARGLTSSVLRESMVASRERRR
ncbi:MarR family transcriptional regulator [Streptomyces sp. Li-HN-5-11]|uniref:MarR family winged helix-turn-helix transcriptional regulator n=1 Tax=Streptomyces sp. Li-HN-5-11 TaxID=3075432 RepID=UPI0028B05259|nr:MarR family transcriptional regulator [Streptomyces sp. Li-HN-5-11]WNM36811.1 MarR family transcriptional regulator [Streptomyces sp. Li-HN-5-11]